MDNNSLKEAARKEIIRREAQKELDRRRAASQPSQVDEKNENQTPPFDYAQDIMRGAGSGIVKGVTGLLGSAGDVQQITGDVLGWGAEKLGFSPEVQSAATEVGKRIAIPGMGKMPTSQQLLAPVEENIGPLPKAESLPGQIVERVGEFAPSAALGPGSLMRRGATALVPAVSSELAGRIPGIEGSPYQPYAETAAGLASGLPVATYGKGSALSEMRSKAPKQQTVMDLKQEAYDAVDRAGIMYDSTSVRKAVSNINSALAGRGWDKMSGGEAAPFVRRVNGLLKGSNSRSWSNVDRILKEAKDVMRSGATPVVKGDVSIIISNLENLVKAGKITSKSGLTRDEINSTIDRARELARRNILAREIETMKLRMPGYLAGDESSFRNQFGAYLKSPESFGLTPAEREAFSKVVRREGPLNTAHNMSSRIGQIAGGVSGSGIGGLTGAFFGPIGAVAGAVAGAATTATAQSAFRKIMDKITENAVDDALKTVLAGREAQREAMSLEKVEDLRRIVRAALISEAATNPAEDNWFLQDATGRKYEVPENAEQSSGGRVARKSGGRIRANPISAEVKRVRTLLSEKTASMLSVPDDAIATALHIAKRT